MSAKVLYSRPNNSILLAFNVEEDDGRTRMPIIDPPAIGSPLSDRTNGAMWVTIMDRNNSSAIIPGWSAVQMLYAGGDVDYSKDTGVQTIFTGLAAGKYGATFWFQQGSFQHEDTVEFTVTAGGVTVAPKP